MLNFRATSSGPANLAVQKHIHLAVLLILLGSVGAVRADDWPHWRGLERNGNVDEASGWTRGNWPGKVLWSGNVDRGSSGPIVVGNRLYTIGWKDDRDHVYCLDAGNGREIWRQSYACPPYGRYAEGDKGLYLGPSSSPSFDVGTGRLYTLSVDGDLNCWDAGNRGQLVWSLNFYDAYNVKQRPKVGRRQLRDYGYTTAPLLHGDAVIVEVGGREGNLMAFSKQTGERLWTSQSNDPAGHTGGIVPIVVEGLPCVAVLTIQNLLVVRSDQGHEGETMAEFPWTTDFANNVATPTVYNNSILITSEFNQYSTARIDVTRSGAQEIWRQPYASGVCPPVVHNGHVYLCWRSVHCLSFDTGESIWSGGRSVGDTSSCIVTSDGRLIVWGRRGDLTLVETADHSPTEYTALAQVRGLLKNDAWPHVVLCGGRLYCKDRDGNIVCFAPQP